MVNSNFYGTDAILLRPTRIQAARAANVTHAAFLFRRLVDRQQLQPVRINECVNVMLLGTGVFLRFLVPLFTFILVLLISLESILFSVSFLLFIF